MSWQRAEEPVCEGRSGRVSLVIEPRERDLGGFSVRRVLPASERRMVGPFIFFDEMGPAQFAPGKGIDVRPHPHIGLATVTYLFEGEIVHRDSLGVVQPIRPGAVNLMTAGRGVVHSERSDPARRASGPRVHGIQTWLALPDGREEIEPDFEHHPDGSLPEVERGGVRVRVVLGEAFGLRSPVRTYATTTYLELRMPPASELELPPVRELGLYVVTGEVTVGECALAPHTMGVLEGTRGARVRAAEESHVIAVGGDPVGPRHIWWNLVSSSTERIERAKRDWAEGRFPAVPGETEFIPLPEG